MHFTAAVTSLLASAMVVSGHPGAAPASELFARDSFDCHGSAMCGSAVNFIRNCDRAVNFGLTRDKVKRYGGSG